MLKGNVNEDDSVAHKCARFCIIYPNKKSNSAKFKPPNYVKKKFICFLISECIRQAYLVQNQYFSEVMCWSWDSLVQMAGRCWRFLSVLRIEKGNNGMFKAFKCWHKIVLMWIQHFVPGLHLYWRTVIFQKPRPENFTLSAYTSSALCTIPVDWFMQISVNSIYCKSSSTCIPYQCIIIVFHFNFGLSVSLMLYS